MPLTTTPITTKFHKKRTNQHKQIIIMADNKVTINPRFMHYNSKEADALLSEVENRSFLRDVTEDEYEALSQEEKENGDLYLLREPDDEEQ